MNFDDFVFRTISNYTKRVDLQIPRSKFSCNSDDLIERLREF